MNRSRTLSLGLGLATALAASVLLSACTTSTRAHPELESRRSRITRVAVLPPEVTFKLITFEGDNPTLAAEEENAKKVLPGLIAAKLRERGLEVIDFESAEVVPGSDLRFQATQLQESFNTAMNDLYKFQQMDSVKAAQIRRSLGPQASRVADPLDVDALVLVNVEGFYKSAGEIAKDVGKSIVIGLMTMGTVVPLSPTQGSAIGFALVDGANGDVLWSNAHGSQAANMGAPGLEGLVNFVFGPFPPGNFGTAVATTPPPSTETLAMQ